MKMHGQAGRLVAPILALLITCFVFFDVVFLRASFTGWHYDAHVTANPIRYVRSLPEREGRSVVHGFMDIGAIAYQVDPYRRFLADAVWSGDTPYWSPFTAAGSVVPDNLTSQVLSPPMIVSALFGGTDAAWTWAMLVLIWLSCSCLVAACLHHLHLSKIAAAGAGLAFLLNGFVTSAPASLVVLPYYLAPPLLLALLRFVDVPSIPRIAIASLAFSMMLTATFIPTLTLSAACVFAIALAYAVMSRAALPRIVLSFAAIGLIGLCLASFVVVPVIDTLMNTPSDLSSYNRRTFQAVDWRALISLLTPKHFWESYNAYQIPRVPLSARDEELNLYCHFGVTASLCAALVFSRAAWRSYPLAIGLTVIVAVLLWRLLGLPGAETIVMATPIIRFFSIQYWPAPVMLSLSLCAGIGINMALRGQRITAAGVVAVILALANVIFLAAYLGAAVRPVNWFYVAVFLGVVVTAAALLMFNTVARAKAVGTLLVCLIAAEGTFYINHLKVRQYDVQRNLPPFIHWLRERTSPSGDRVFVTTQRGGLQDYAAMTRIPDVGTMSYLGKSEFYSRFFNNHLGANSAGLAWGLSDAVGENPSLVAGLTQAGARYVVTEPGRRQAWIASNLPLVYSEGPVSIFENANALPRVRLVGTLLPGDKIAADYNLSPRQTATTMDEALLNFRLTGSVSGSAAVETYRNGYVRIRAEAPEPSILVMIDAWNPRWSGTVDGQPAHIGRVDAAFRGIALSPGAHIVEMRYDGWAVTYPLWFSLFAHLCVIGAMLPDYGKFRISALPRVP